MVIRNLIKNFDIVRSIGNSIYFKLLPPDCPLSGIKTVFPSVPKCHTCAYFTPSLAFTEMCAHFAGNELLNI